MALTLPEWIEFANDSIYFDLSPEQTLILAMIQNAILDAMRPMRCEGFCANGKDTGIRKIRNDALYWLRKNKLTTPWSVMWCLEHLTDEPNLLYTRLMGRLK